MEVEVEVEVEGPDSSSAVVSVVHPNSRSKWLVLQPRQATS